MKLISRFEEAAMDDIAPSPGRHIVTMALSQVASGAHYWCHTTTDFPQSLNIPHGCNILTSDPDNKSNVQQNPYPNCDQP